MKSVSTSKYFFAFAMLSSILLSGCNNNKSEYTEQINHYINNTNACVSIPFQPYSWKADEMPNDSVDVKISIPKTNLDEEKLIKYNNKIRIMDSLTKLGFFTKGETKDRKDNFFKSEEIGTTYYVTNQGIEQFDKNSNGKPIFGKLCFGSITVDNISEPKKITYGEVAGEEIDYDWKISYTKKYAQESSFLSVFDIKNSGVSSVFFAKDKNGGFIGFPVVDEKISMLNTLQLNGFTGQLNQDLSKSLSDSF